MLENETLLYNKLQLIFPFYIQLHNCLNWVQFEKSLYLFVVVFFIVASFSCTFNLDVLTIYNFSQSFDWEWFYIHFEIMNILWDFYFSVSCLYIIFNSLNDISHCNIKEWNVKVISYNYLIRIFFNSVGRDAALLHGEEGYPASWWPAPMQPHRGKCRPALLQPDRRLCGHR